MENENVKVLLVEDDTNLGNLLKEYLEAKGYNTVLAVNGKQGYDVFINLCEGYPEWEIPGIDVTFSMESLNLPFTGPSTKLYDVPKELMKYVAFCEGVVTPGFVLVNEMKDLDDGLKKLKYPKKIGILLTAMIRMVRCYLLQKIQFFVLS